MSLYIRIAILFGMISSLGCVREVKDLKDFPEDRGTVQAKIAAKQAEGEAAQAIKKRLEEGHPDLRIDPWVPPQEMPVEKLPRALQAMPKDNYGYPDWTAAVSRGLLSPLNSLEEASNKKGYMFAEGSKEAVEAAESFAKEEAPGDVIFEINDRLMFNVIFPHKIHTYWLSCKVCHPGIFVAKKGANTFTMPDVWDGKFCGRCHGKVSFQPKGYNNCKRCHSQNKKVMGVGR